MSATPFEQVRRIDAAIAEGRRLFVVAAAREEGPDPSTPVHQGDGSVGAARGGSSERRLGSRARRMHAARGQADAALAAQLESGPLLARLVRRHEDAELRLRARVRSLRRKIFFARLRLFFVEHWFKLVVISVLVALSWAAWRYGPDAWVWMERKAEELRRSLEAAAPAPGAASGGAGPGAGTAPAAESKP